MKKGSHPLVLTLAAAVVSACASGSAGTPSVSPSDPPAAQASRATKNRNIITTEELAASDASNALQAVQRLRPNFLQTRGQWAQGQTPIVVYVNEVKMSDPSALERIPITDVKEIRYLNGTDATQRYGTGHGAGAIVVVRK